MLKLAALQSPVRLFLALAYLWAPLPLLSKTQGQLAFFTGVFGEGAQGGDDTAGILPLKKQWLKNTQPMVQKGLQQQ